MDDSKKSFVLYCDQREPVELLSNEQAGALFKALYALAATGTDTALEDGMTRMCYAFIASQMKRDNGKYEEKCRRLSANARKKGADAEASVKELDDGTQESAQESTQAEAIAPKTAESSKLPTACSASKEAIPAAPASDLPEAMTVHSAKEASPVLDDEARERLLAKGLPAAYIDERAGRAAFYAHAHGENACNVLLEWWRTDRARAPWNGSQTNAPPAPIEKLMSSFDTDDFFAAALRHSFQDA